MMYDIEHNKYIDVDIEETGDIEDAGATIAKQSYITGKVILQIKYRA